MEEKIYRCDGELEALICKQGWIETTRAFNKIKGKKEFRKGRNGRVLMLFDYINLVVFENNRGCSGIGGSAIPAASLRLLFWYLKSTAADKEIISNGHFDLVRAQSSHQTMTSLLGYAKEFGRSDPESLRYERLLRNYENALLN